MNEAFAQTLAAFELTLRLALPILGAAFAVACAIALLQALFRLTEPALNAIPRALITLLVLGAIGPWLSGQLVAYTLRLFRALPELVR
jgi:flagellar biosynthetic protein FliQ